MFLSSFFGSLPDRVVLMTAAGSVHNHLGWLGVWPLAEPDNSELSDFYPPLNSDRERETERESEKDGEWKRERERGRLGAYHKGRGSRSEKQGVEERMRRETKRKRAWRHRWRGEDHTALLTLEALTLSKGDRHQGEGRRWKERAEEKVE